MPENTTPESTPQGQSPAGSEGFKLPEKFASASKEDVAKAYVELERKFGESSGRLKNLEAYEKLGDVKQIAEAVEWARGIYSQLQKGELVSASDQRKAEKITKATTVEGQAPWEAADWEIRTPSEQAKALAEYQTSEVRKMIAAKEAELSGALGQFRAVQGKEQQILLEAIKESIASGGKVDVNTILTNAAALASKSPEELLKMAIKQLTAGDDQKAEVERLVNERLALENQKRENDALTLVNQSTSPKPKFVSSKKSREDTNKLIIDKLKKNGINLLQ